MANKEKKSGNFLIVGVSILIALGLVGLAAYVPIKNALDKQRVAAVSLSDLGEPASVCAEVTTKPATGNQDHVAEGTELTFTDTPPAFGQHYDNWETMERQLYTAKDRPPVGRLLHNLEHGYTILWYDETIADDEAAMKVLRDIASKFSEGDSLENKFKVAPWTSEDGGEFPEGQHVAFTHWSKGGIALDAADEQLGVWQYCSAVSGEALESFMTKYPYLDSPEPDIP